MTKTTEVDSHNILLRRRPEGSYHLLARDDAKNNIERLVRDNDQLLQKVWDLTVALAVRKNPKISANE